jgi:hypothetical protein
MSKINLIEKSDFEGKNIIVNNLNILPIFTKKWFDRVECFVKEDGQSYSIFKLIPYNTNFKDILNDNDAYVFVIYQDNKIFIRDIGGIFTVTPDFLRYLELVNTD